MKTVGEKLNLLKKNGGMKEMTLREQQLFSLEILKDVHAFCEANHIMYSLYGGTLIGAIRHKGFIPWDDDIDIIMPRPDYDRFCSIYKSEKYAIVNMDTDKTFSFAYSRVCDRKQTKYETYYPCNRDGMGVWIDIFPADGFPSKEEEIPLFYKKILALEKRKSFFRVGLQNSSSLHYLNSNHSLYRKTRRIVKTLLIKFVLYINGWKNPYVRRQITMCHLHEYGSTPYWGAITSPYRHVVYHPIKDFKSCSLMQFEDSFFYVMNGYDGLLRRVYGDYMKLPPAEEQKPPLKGSYVFYWL